MKYLLLTVLLYFLFTSVTQAAIGCLSSNTTYTYINPTGNYISGAQEYYHRYESDRRTTASNFCTSPIIPTSPCYITATRDGYSSSPGTRVNYTTVNNCGFDSYGYTASMLLCLGGLGIHSIKRKTVKEN